MTDSTETPDDNVAPEDNDSVSSYNIETRRLLHGPVGTALASARPAEMLVENILDALDQGDGWIEIGDSGGTWYPGRLAVHLYSSHPPLGPPVLRVDTAVVELESETKSLHAQLNDLNVHAAGWWWWFDRPTRRVMCSMSCVADPTAWWWSSVLLGVLPIYATETESMADELAQANQGHVCLAEHRDRGLRSEVDGYVVAVRLGARDMRASLDLWLSTLDYSQLHSALGLVTDGASLQVDSPLCARIEDATGQLRVVLRRHWHAELGWGWQIATLSGISTHENESTDDLLLVASLMNMRQHADGSHNRFGGWVHLRDLGLTHLTFVPAIEIEKVLDIAESTAGHVAALMIDFETRKQDLSELEAEARPSVQGPLTMFAVPEDDVITELMMANLKAGVLGWSYLDRRVQERFLDGWRGGTGADDDDDGGDCWLLPRHVVICSFGIFNPMGPTVSSLEAGFVVPLHGEPYWDLYWILRHPLSPEITSLGSAASLEELDPLIADSLAETEELCIFGSGPDWLDIFGKHHGVIEGARRFAAARPDTDWKIEAMALFVHSSDPWARISEGVTGEEFDWPDDLDPVEGWLQAITDLDVIAGHQLFLRSAWEGATAYKDSGWQDSELAQAATDAMTQIARERSLADYEFRERESPLVKHAQF